jgi:Na+/proline symporter
MRLLDWAVLLGTLVAIVGWGLWRERGVKSAEAYLRGRGDLRWWAIGLSVMATQASAITYLSLPGQAYEDGMGFIQFYFGLPIAMVLLSAVALPIYYRLRVHTAYEYLETRFDRKTRQLTALLFLLSRGLAAGVSIYAPAIVLSAVLGWPLQATNLAIGTVVVLYTVSGGTRIVSRTQTWQMVVMAGGMIAAAGFLLSQLPDGLSLNQAAHVAGALGKMQVVDLSARLDTRYTLWSGLAGGLFVQLAYFGTDQSQVQRYLGGQDLTQSRLGLLMNGLVKVPMQFLILGIGVLLLVFHQFHEPPVFFDEVQWSRAHQGAKADEARAVDLAWDAAFERKRARVEELVLAVKHDDAAAVESAKAALRQAAAESSAVRERAKSLVPFKDADHIFIGFVVSHFPAGLLGLFLAVVLCAAMSALAAALDALGTTTMVDFYRPIFGASSDRRELVVAKLCTVGWGVLAVLFAVFAAQIDNLIQAVNILGSIFYGPMLGVFLVGFFLKRVRGTPVFLATLLAQAAVVAVFALSSIGFLWYNVIGCATLVGAALVLNRAVPARVQG